MFNKTNKFGGTEYMLDGVNSFMPLMPKLNNYMLLAMPGMIPDDLTLIANTPKIIWLHNTPNQLYSNLTNALFYAEPLQNSIHKWIVPSDDLKKGLLEIGIDESKIIILPNAIEPMNPSKDKWQNVKTIKAVYSSGLNRGLIHLLNAWDKLDANIELSIFGEWDKEPQIPYDFNVLEWEKFTNDPRISFYGFAHRNTLRRYLEQEAHLFLYPSHYRETFCIAMAEAISAGLSVCTSNTGALQEIGNDYIKTFDWDMPFQSAIYQTHINQINSYLKFAKSAYNKSLKEFIDISNNSVEEIKTGKFDPSEQINYINNKYGWDTVKQMWLDFHDSLPEKP